jgi:hypothetical protein
VDCPGPGGAGVQCASAPPLHGSASSGSYPKDLGLLHMAVSQKQCLLVACEEPPARCVRRLGSLGCAVHGRRRTLCDVASLWQSAAAAWRQASSLPLPRSPMPPPCPALQFAPTLQSLLGVRGRYKTNGIDYSAVVMSSEAKAPQGARCGMGVVA